MRPSLRSVATFVALLSSLSLLACGDDAVEPADPPSGGSATGALEPAPPPPTGPAGITEVRSSNEELTDEQLAAVPATLVPRDLQPVFVPVGPGDAVPTGFAVELARAVAAPSQVGGPALEGTVLTIEPELPGEVRLASPSTLVFHPSEPPTPDTEYRVVLEAVGTPHAVLKPEPAGSWASVVRTPGFRALGAGFESLSYDEDRGAVELRFSGPVSTSEVKQRLSIAVDGRSRPADVMPAGPYRVRVPLAGREVQPGTRVRVSLASGVPLLGRQGVSAGGLKADLVMPRTPPVELVGVRRGEGPSGWYVDVICRDEAAPDGWNGWWDEETSTWYDLTSRCLPADGAAGDSITVSPAVADLRISPTRQGFRILGDFGRGAYTVTFAEGLTSQDGGVLPSQRDASFVVPARSPQVQFVSKGRYLPATAWAALPVRHLNLSEVTLEVRHVPERNLVHWLTGDDERADGRTSDLVAEVPLPVSGPADGFGTTWLDLGSVVPERENGVYEVRVAGGSASDTSRVLVTGLHLLAKRAEAAPDAPQATAVDVWAVDADTLQPVGGAKLDVRKRSGTVLARCTTSNRGHCRLDPGADAIDPEGPYVLVADTGDDLTYLRFEDLQTPLTEAAVAGEPFLAPEAYRIATYSDRGVYRPGETAHLAAVVRGEDRKAPKVGMPVTLALSDPRGRVLGRHTLHTDPAGFLAHDVELGDWAPTGRYTASFTVGDEQLASYGFYVEEFVPERMEVSVALGAEDLLAGDRARATIEARYLFGGSAEGSPAEVECELVPASFAPATNGQYTYGAWRGAWEGEQRGLSLGAAAGELDRDGRTTLDCPSLGDGARWEGTGRLVARAVVFEAGSGRSTQETTSSLVHPERYYLGLQTGTEEAKQGEPIAVQGVVVDWTGATSDAVSEVTLRAYRLEDEYGWWYDEDDGYGSYRRTLRKVEQGSQTVPVSGGRFSWTVTPEDDGAGFLVVASAGDAETGLELDGTSNYWWWSDPDQSADVTPKPLKPGTLELTLPEAVAVGKQGEVTWTAPYSGRALYTVETHEVTTWAWAEVKPGPNSWRFPVEVFSPNVYVSVLLLKDPHADSAQAYLPDRAFGVGSVPVEAAQYVQPLVITAPDEVQPGDELTIEVAAKGAEPGTVVTVAAVDEGILQLTDFASPDPLAELLAKRALGVSSFETVGWSILVPPEGATSSTGGDAPDDALGRADPVEPVALWSGPLAVDGGKATVTFTVPRYRGKLRVMAVSAGPTRVGHADDAVLVRDPLVLQTTMPRFLVEGDRVEVPVFVTNMSGRSQDVTVGIEAARVGPALAGAPAAPPLEIVGGATRRLTLGDEQSGTAVFEVIARQQVGTAKLAVVAKAGDLVSRDEAVVPFNPDAPRTRALHEVELTAGANDLSPWVAGWVPTTERTTVRVTTNPYGDVFDHLTYLVRYPYGCIEQTTSSTRPMLFVDRLIQQVDPEIATDGGIAKRVNHGIRRVLSMQTGGGGFGYWPGSNQPAAWASAYATHMLLDARERGYDVPDVALDDALRWMEQQVESGRSEGWRDGLPYMHYVLARAGRGRKALASQLLARTEGSGNDDGLVAESSYLLKAALWQAGDRRYEEDLRDPDTSNLRDERRNGWSFYSDRRRRGLTLTLFGELFGNDPDGEELASLVANALSGQRSSWYTTQELVWGVTGLGRRIADGAKDFSVPVLAAGGTTLEPRWTDRDTSERAFEVNRLSERGPVTLTVEDIGGGALYALVSSEGVEEGAVWEERADGIRVDRSHLDGEGRPIDPTAVSLGDLVVTRVDLTNLTSEDMRNVALVDRLPAGFEIENANLGRDLVIDVVDASRLWERDHMNVRDDRVEVFGTLPRGRTVSFVYASRATAAGDFVVPPVEAEAMYEPRLRARQVGGRVVVVGPWAGVTEVAPEEDAGE